VQFFIFKSNLKLPQNNSKLIFSQIEDFVKNTDPNRIKIIRTINTITLQYDEELPAVKIEDALDIYEDEALEMIDEISCSYNDCGNMAETEIDLEIHKFLKHSSFGMKLEGEIEKSKEVSFDFQEESAMNSSFRCKNCNTQFESGDILLSHILADHCIEMIEHINSILHIPFVVDIKKITSYLNFIHDCINGFIYELTIDSEIRTYFYVTYNTENKTVVHEEELVDDDDILFDTNIEEQSDIEMQEVKKYVEKRDEVTAEDKEWLKEKIFISKITVTDNGVNGSVYRCMVTTTCDYVSNSPQGLRYHLMIKHMKDRHLYEEHKSEEIALILESKNAFFIPEKTKNTAKNFCSDCSLKFKDNRAYALHQKSHELFPIVAMHISFPFCNTCNVRFIDEKSLNKHLLRHETDENLQEPIEVSNGAVREQGKFAKSAENSKLDGETVETTFSWKCGHCESKYFTSEDNCNLHLLMHHVSCFSCPIDKMEFHGFKCVSLFIHHLRNKHSDLFPNLSFKCTLCHLNFGSIYDKLQHMKICDSKKFRCDHCDKRFYRKNELQTHLRFVSGEFQFECE
jgi:hypothetical protein